MSILPHLADPASAPPPLASAGAGALLLVAVVVDWTAPARRRPRRADAVRDLVVALAVTAGVASLAAAPSAWAWRTLGPRLAAPAAAGDHSTAVGIAAAATTLVLAAVAVTVAALTPTLTGRTGEPTGVPAAFARARTGRSCAATSWPLWACAALPGLLAGAVPGPAGVAVRALVWADQAAWSAPFAAAIGRDRSATGAWSTAVALVWLVSVGWRPQRVLIPSPTALRSAWATVKCLVRRDSDSDSASTTGRDRARPVGAGRVRELAPGVLASGAGTTVRARPAVVWQPAAWWRRQWAGARPVATAAPVPARVPTRAHLHRWIRRNLELGRPTTDIVRRGTNTLGGRSEATMWREVRRVRRDLAAAGSTR